LNDQSLILANFISELLVIWNATLKFFARPTFQIHLYTTYYKWDLEMTKSEGFEFSLALV